MSFFSTAQCNSPRLPAGFLSGSLHNLISHRSAQLREKIGLNETVAEGFEHRGLSGYYRLMKRYFALSPEPREVRPAATSLDTYRDIIYLEPVICWDVSPPRAVQSQHRTGSRDHQATNHGTGVVCTFLGSFQRLRGYYLSYHAIMAALECSQASAGATHLIHPPITLSRDKTLKCFWTVCTFYLSARLYILSRDPRNCFIQQ